MYCNMQMLALHLPLSQNTFLYRLNAFSILSTYHGLICNSKTSTNSSFLHHIFTDRFALIEDLRIVGTRFYFFVLRTFTFSIKGSTLQLLFGRSELPVLLLLCFGAAIKEIKVT